MSSRFLFSQSRPRHRVLASPFGNPLRHKRKGLQLALKPLNGRGIAGYVPKPKFWTRPVLVVASREETSHVVGALGVLGDVEAFTLGLDIGTQADDHIDDLV
jgi:hypothetical protein